MLSLRLSRTHTQVVREIAKNSFKLLSFETLIEGEGVSFEEISIETFFLFLWQSAPVEFYGIPLKDEILLEAPARIVIAACRGKIDEGKYKDFCKQCEGQGDHRVLESFFKFVAGLTLENQESCFEDIVCILRIQGSSTEGSLDHIIQRLQKGKLNLLLFLMKLGKIPLKVS